MKEHELFKFGHANRHAYRHCGLDRRSGERQAGRGRDGDYENLGGFGGGPRGHLGDMLRGGGRGGRRRLFSSDELRLVLLKLIGDQPRHGYDLMRAIEEQSGGAYAPSPGVVYPTITLLQDMDHIAEQAAEGTKRQFAITEAGRATLAEKAEEVETLLARLARLAEESGATDRSPVRRAMANLAMALRTRMTSGEQTPDLAHDIAAILDETVRRIERL